MGSLREAFDAAVTESTVIETVDQAIVAAGRSIADQIDYASANLSGQELTKALYLMPHLVNILKELLATPAARKAASIGREAPSGKLSGLRSVPKPA